MQATKRRRNANSNRASDDPWSVKERQDDHVNQYVLFENPTVASCSHQIESQNQEERS